MKIYNGELEILAKQASKNLITILSLVEDALKKEYDMIVFPRCALTGVIDTTDYNLSLEEELDSLHDVIIQQSKRIAIVFGSYYHNQEVIFVAIKQQLVEFGNGQNYLEFLNQEEYSFEYLKRRFVFKETTESNEIRLLLLNQPYYLDDCYSFSNQTVAVNSRGLFQKHKNFQLNYGGSYLNYDSFKTETKKPPLLEVLVYSIRTFDFSFGKGKPWIIGLSGGLDSAVMVALLVLALGKDRVLAYNLSSVYNSPDTIKNSEYLKEVLDLNFKKISIDDLADSLIKTLKDLDYKVNDLNLENIYARTRGQMLASLAGINEGLIINNTNKIEKAMGYFTLQGDNIGAISILGDLNKVTLIQLGKELNKEFKRIVIPENLFPVIQDNRLVFEVDPSAELSDNQKDPMKWYYHDYLLDLILRFGYEYPLKKYLEGSLFDVDNYYLKQIYDLDNPTVFIIDYLWFTRKLSASTFKRMQMPPTLMLHRYSFNFFKENMFDYRSLNFEKLIQLILEK